MAHNFVSSRSCHKIVQPTSSLPQEQSPSRPRPPWVEYLSSLSRYVLLKALVDLAISLTLVLAFYVIALALSRLVPSQFAYLAARSKDAAIIVGFLYLIAVMITATIRFYRFVKRDTTPKPDTHVPQPRGQEANQSEEGDE